MESCRALYGDERITPKFHQMVHFVFFLSAMGWIPNCWVLQRKHRSAKRFASMSYYARGKKVGYSAGILREITARHVSKLRRADSVHFVEHACLIAPRRASKRVARLLANEFDEGCTFCSSTSARINQWEKIAQGDVVSYHWEGSIAYGKVDMLASVTIDEEHGAFAYISSSDTVRTRDRDVLIRFSGTHRMVILSEIHCSLIWSEGADGHASVLRPWSQR